MKAPGTKLLAMRLPAPPGMTRRPYSVAAVVSMVQPDTWLPAVPFWSRTA